jgi:hypothetical protein
MSTAMLPTRFTTLLGCVVPIQREGAKYLPPSPHAVVAMVLPPASSATTYEIFFVTPRRWRRIHR